MGTLLAMIVSLVFTGCGHTSQQPSVNMGGDPSAVEDSVATPAGEQESSEFEIPSGTGTLEPGSGALRPSAPGVGRRSRTGPGWRNRGRAGWVPEKVSPQPYFNASTYYQQR